VRQCPSVTIRQEYDLRTHLRQQSLQENQDGEDGTADILQPYEEAAEPNTGQAWKGLLRILECVTKEFASAGRIDLVQFIRIQHIGKLHSELSVEE